MSSKWRHQAILGLSAFLLTFLFSMFNNTWITALLWAAIGFLLFFILGSVIRLVIHQSISKQQLNTRECLKVEKTPEVETLANDNIENPMNDTSFHAVPLDALHGGEKTKTKAP
ncbi:hypothetical protein [Neobacillus thermocopriae]|uniref:Uncharacterized protein n=1 Tax=Neobacillus thermocopriae TaxID=1215031 RepID=A0A6B3TN76_9BACI|nr:hypothetical protein [Neobacillus thermocopriae]MED3623980.1 hypothetical protein [Neobacillus thermocopriae]MED3713825.1 hypothetical protein [Neobacillus thermocopriae]NEX78032.1 hypothetical protein [Neobacillus thermocopriae]